MQYRCRATEHITRCPNIAQFRAENPAFAYLPGEKAETENRIKFIVICMA